VACGQALNPGATEGGGDRKNEDKDVGFVVKAMMKIFCV
jgi:hypothetical protein